MESNLAKIMEYYEKSCIYGKIYEDKYDALKKLSEYIDLSGVCNVYVKNLGGTELKDEIYVFSRKLILKIAFQLKANGVFADYQCYKLANVSSVRMIDDISYDKDVVLDIDFNDGGKITIDNREDLSGLEEDLKNKKLKVSKAILESVFKEILKFIAEER